MNKPIISIEIQIVVFGGRTMCVSIHDKMVNKVFPISGSWSSISNNWYNRVSKGKLYLKVYISSLEVRQNVIGATITNVRSFENHIQIDINDW